MVQIVSKCPQNAFEQTNDIYFALLGMNLYIYGFLKYFFFHFQICNELQECHASTDSILRNHNSVPLLDIETLVSKEDSISKKVQELREQQRQQDEDILASLDEAINITEQSLNAVQRKMYGDFVDQLALNTTALKVSFGSKNFLAPTYPEDNCIH